MIVLGTVVYEYWVARRYIQIKDFLVEREEPFEKQFHNVFGGNRESCPVDSP